VINYDTELITTVISFKVLAKDLFSQNVFLTFFSRFNTTVPYLERDHNRSVNDDSRSVIDYSTYFPACIVTCHLQLSLTIVIVL
jgi:hypothetical protein